MPTTNHGYAEGTTSDGSQKARRPSCSTSAATSCASPRWVCSHARSVSLPASLRDASATTMENVRCSFALPEADIVWDAASKGTDRQRCDVASERRTTAVYVCASKRERESEDKGCRWLYS